MFWHETDKSLIEFVSSGKERHKFRYSYGPLRFQIPRGVSTWGVSKEYKSFQIDLNNPEFFNFWKDLETHLCSNTPFNSNLKGTTLRLKIDDSVLIFDQNSKQVVTEVRDGLFRGQELSCLIDVDSTYFFNGNWGLTCRAVQVKYVSDPVEEDEDEDEETITKGACAFI